MSKRKRKVRKIGRPKGSKDKTKRKITARDPLTVAQTIIEGQKRELARLRTEVSDLKGAIEPVQEMYREARRDACALQAEEQHMKARVEYAYGSMERLGKIRQLEAEVYGLQKAMLAPTAAWNNFMVSGMPDSIEEVWRLIEVDRQTRREQPGDR